MRIAGAVLTILLCATLASAQQSDPLRPKERPEGQTGGLQKQPQEAPLLETPQIAAAPNPLTAQERTAFVRQVAACWNTGGLSKVAQQTVVTVRFGLDPQGRPLRDSLQLIGAGKDTRQTTKDAYAAAKRAILRCGAGGYKLPLEKYEEWKDIEITFNPERMSNR